MNKPSSVLPRDRDVVVYLGYDLLHLGRYEDLLALTHQYNNVLPKEPDIPLLAGYVHKHNNQEELARQDFTEASATRSRSGHCLCQSRLHVERPP